MSAAEKEGGWVLQVSAGTGPVEVRRFVARLAEHLVEVCDAEGARVRNVTVRGDEATPRSVEIELDAAPLSIGALAGTHALVARSLSRGKRSRKRWYAGVRLYPIAAGGAVSAVDPRDVEITAMRAGGPGGQHVNKTASAVRALHRPSGIVVRVADERSQRENVELALLRLSRALAERADARARGALAERRLGHYRVERGRPSFVYEATPAGELAPREETSAG